MIRVRNIILTFSILTGVLLLIPVINTCERFDPAGEVYFYMDTVTVQNAGESYLFSGAVVNTGKKPIRQHGFCWDKAPGPTIEEGDINLLGPLAEPYEFTASVNDLDAHTTYHIRVYVTTDAGTEYSNEKTFTTISGTVPTVTTTPVTHIAADSAQSGGVVSADGGTPVTARGVCWDTTATPTIEGSHTTDGNGMGTYTSLLTGLACQTKYYVRAYATNSEGTAYGDTVSFTTGDCPEGIPSLTTAAVTNVTANSAQCGGTVISDGGFTVTQRGVCWSTSEGPTISDSLTSDGSETGSFASSITDLDPATKYYVRAYATNSEGTGYGNEESFTTKTDGAGDLVAFYPFNGNAEDESGYERHGTVVGATLTSDWLGNENSAYSFDGENDRIEIPRHDITNTSSRTFNFWFKTDDVNNEGYFLHAWETTDVTDFGIVFYPQSGQDEIGFNYAVENGHYDWFGFPNSGNITPDTWYMITAVYEVGMGCKLYLDGTEMASNSTLTPYATRPQGTGSFTIGSYGPDWYLDMVMDDLRIWDKALTGEEITALYEGSGVIYSPEVTTAPISEVTRTSAVSGGEVTDDGGGTITMRGVCWSTSAEPSLSDDITEDGKGVGSFTSTIYGLVENTTYYVRAYATNSAGTAYGDTVSFTTKGITGTVTDYDGNEYNTVQIGDQVWMAENLKVTTYANGEDIPLVENGSAWAALSSTDQAYCWYDNSTLNGDIYGALYSWAAAMHGADGSDLNPSDIQGVCPDGWHLPSDAEWKQMEIYLGMLPTTADNTGLRGSQGNNLKEAGTENWPSPNANADNASGFTALPGGYRNIDGIFAAKGFSAFFWTSAESDESLAWSRDLYSNFGGIYRTGIQMDKGYSVRCVEGEGYSVPTLTTDPVNEIMDTMAISGGQVLDDGGTQVIAKGLCWSTTENPTLEDAEDYSDRGTGSASFTSEMRNLTPGTEYYVRAYATNSVGTGYGSQVTFTTTSGLGCPAGMVSYWKLEEANPPYLDVMGGHNGSAPGSAPTRKTGIIGYAQQFETSSPTYITIPDHEDFDWDGLNSFSIELWVKLTDISTSNMVFIGRDDDVGAVHWWIGAQANTARTTFMLVNSAGTGTTSVLSGMNLDIGSWHHIVVIRNYVSGLNVLYVDGMEDVNSLVDYSDGDFSSDATIDIGAFNYDGTPGQYPAPAVIDEVAIYNRALSDMEIYEHFDKGTRGDGYCE